VIHFKNLFSLSVCCMAILSACNPDAVSESIAEQTPHQLAVKAEQVLAPAVEDWADGLFATLLSEYRISGGAIAVTQGDRVVLSKGFGYADWVSQKPAGPDSQFRIASLSKTFLATLVVQLYESGQIKSLDDPANKYLTRFQMPDYQGKQVTIRDLLTHQGGYGTNGPIPDDPRPAAPLSPEMILANLPDIVREPGTMSFYCNPCTATLGMIVEDMTGMTIKDYMQEHLFTPLGMYNSSWAVEVTPGPDMVSKFAFAAGRPPAALPYPAAGSPYTYYSGPINSTADDMAKWLISNIKAGEGSGPSVLTPASYQLMQTRQRGNHPDSSGFGLKHFIYDYNGEKVLEHYGSIQFRSLQLMMLDKEIGVFITVAGGGHAEQDAVWSEAAVLPQDAVVMEAASHSGLRAAVLEYFLGSLSIDGPNLTAEQLSVYAGEYDSLEVDPSVQVAGDPDLIITLAPNADGLVINGLGVFRPSGTQTFVLDGPTPLEMGFRFGNRYSFKLAENGALQMFPHVNAGGFVKR